MAKTTKQSSSKKDDTNEKPLIKKTASRKVQSKKVSAKPKAPGKKAATKKAAVKDQRFAKKAISRKTRPKTDAAPKAKAAASDAVLRKITYAERRQMIAEAAYLRAESQGFSSDEREDWLTAEAEVDTLLTRAGVIITD